MARSSAQDPLDKFRWIVEIDGFTRLGFHSVMTPEFSVATRNYAEGGAHLTPRQIADSLSYSPVTLARGVTNDTSFNKWATGMFDLVTNNYAMSESSPTTQAMDATSFGEFVGAVNANNRGAKNIPSNDTYPFVYRRDVTIQHINRNGQVEVVYILYDAFPIRYKPASDFSALDDDGVSIETLVLGYEGFDVRYTGINGFLGNLASQILI